jgi:hypothetical protein
MISRSAHSVACNLAKNMPYSSLMKIAFQIKDLNHDNILPFIGACVEPGEVCYVTQHCSRGSVQVLC